MAHIAIAYCDYKYHRYIEDSQPSTDLTILNCTLNLVPSILNLVLNCSQLTIHRQQLFRKTDQIMISISLATI